MTDQWWTTTWGRLGPGDEIQAPDGSTWKVGGSIVSDGAGEWLIGSERGSVWTPHRVDESVSARRPGVPDGGLDLEVALGGLRAVLGTVDPVPEVALRPGAGRWVGCGAMVCRCR